MTIFMPALPTIDSASVKVMRSFDYCHFEVVLGSTSAVESDGSISPLTPELVDELRKKAARLADKAVAQYKLAKADHEKRISELRELRWEREEVQRLERAPETERTPEDQARIKAFRDEEHANRVASRRQYDYQDDWRDDDEVDDE